MTLHFSDPEIEALALELAHARGVSPETAILLALQEAAERTANRNDERATDQTRERRRRFAAIRGRYQARPLLDARSPEDIIGYGVDGVPR